MRTKERRRRDCKKQIKKKTNLQRDELKKEKCSFFGISKNKSLHFAIGKFHYFKRSVCIRSFASNWQLQVSNQFFMQIRFLSEHWCSCSFILHTRGSHIITNWVLLCRFLQKNTFSIVLFGYRFQFLAFSRAHTDVQRWLSPPFSIFFFSISAARSIFICICTAWYLSILFDACISVEARPIRRWGLAS